MQRQITLNADQQSKINAILELGFKIKDNQLELPPEDGVGISACVISLRYGERIELKYNDQFVCNISLNKSKEITDIFIDEENLKIALATHKENSKLLSKTEAPTIPTAELGAVLADIHNNTAKPNAGQLTIEAALRSLQLHLYNADTRPHHIVKPIPFVAMGSETGIHVTTNGATSTISLPTDDRQPRVMLALAAARARKEQKETKSSDAKNTIEIKLPSPDSISAKFARLTDIDISLDDKANLLSGYAKEYQEKYNALHKDEIDKNPRKKLRVRFWIDSDTYLFQVVDELSDLNPEHQAKLQTEFLRTFSADFNLSIGLDEMSDLCNRAAPGPKFSRFLGGTIGFNPVALSSEQIRPATAPRPVAEQHLATHADEFIHCYQTSVERILGKEQTTYLLGEQTSTPDEQKLDFDSLKATNVAYVANSRVDFGASREVIGHLELLYRARQIDKALLINHGNVPEHKLSRLIYKLEKLDKQYAAVKEASDNMTDKERDVISEQEKEKDTRPIDAKTIAEALRLEALRDKEWEETAKQTREKAIQVKSEREAVQKEQQRYFEEYDSVLNELIAASSFTETQKDIYTRIRHDFAMQTQSRLMTCVSDSAANTIILSQFKQRPYVALSWDGVVTNPETKEQDAVVTLSHHFPTQTQQKIHFRRDLSGSMSLDEIYPRNADGEIINSDGQICKLVIEKKEIDGIHGYWADQSGKMIEDPAKHPIVQNRCTLTADMIEAMTIKNAGKPNRSFSYGVFQSDKYYFACAHVDGMCPEDVEAMITKVRNGKLNGGTPLALALVADEQLLLNGARFNTNTQHKFVYFTDGLAADPEYVLEDAQKVPGLLKPYWKPVDEEELSLYKALQISFFQHTNSLEEQGIKISDECFIGKLHQTDFGKMHREFQEKLLKKGSPYRLSPNTYQLQWNISVLVKNIANNLKDKGVPRSSYVMHMVAISSTFDESKKDKTAEEVLAQAETRAITEHLGNPRLNKYIALPSPAAMATARAQLDSSEAVVEVGARLYVNPEFEGDVQHTVKKSDHSQLLAFETNHAVAKTLRIPLRQLSKTQEGNATVAIEIKHQDQTYQFIQSVPRTTLDRLQNLEKGSKVKAKLVKTDITDELLRKGKIDLDASLAKQFPTAADVQRGLNLIRAAKQAALDAKDAEKVEFLNHLQIRFQIVKQGKDYVEEKAHIDKELAEIEAELKQVATQKAAASKEAKEKEAAAAKARQDLISASRDSKSEQQIKLAKARCEELQRQLTVFDTESANATTDKDSEARKLIAELISELEERNGDDSQQTAFRRFKEINLQRMFSPYTLDQLSAWTKQLAEGNTLNIPADLQSKEKLDAETNTLRAKIAKYSTQKKPHPKSPTADQKAIKHLQQQVYAISTLLNRDIPASERADLLTIVNWFYSIYSESTKQSDPAFRIRFPIFEALHRSTAVTIPQAPVMGGYINNVSSRKGHISRYRFKTSQGGTEHAAILASTTTLLRESRAQSIDPEAAKQRETIQQNLSLEQAKLDALLAESSTSNIAQKEMSAQLTAESKAAEEKVAALQKRENELSSKREKQFKLSIAVEDSDPYRILSPDVSEKACKASIDRCAKRLAMSMGLFTHGHKYTLPTTESSALAEPTSSPVAQDSQVLSALGHLAQQLSELKIETKQNTTQILKSISEAKQAILDRFEKVKHADVAISRLATEEKAIVPVRETKEAAGLDPKLKKFNDALKAEFAEFLVVKKLIAEEKIQPDQDLTKIGNAVLAKVLNLIPLPYMGLLTDALTSAITAVDKSFKRKEADKTVTAFSDSDDIISQFAYQVTQDFRNQIMKGISSKSIIELAKSARKRVIYYILSLKEAELKNYIKQSNKEKIYFLRIAVIKGKSSGLLGRNTRLEPLTPKDDAKKEKKTVTDEGLWRSAIRTPDGSFFACWDGKKEKAKAQAMDRAKKYGWHYGTDAEIKEFNFHAPVKSESFSPELEITPELGTPMIMIGSDSSGEWWNEIDTRPRGKRIGR